MTTETYTVLDLAEIAASPDNIRSLVDDDSIAELADSIRTVGVLNPIRVQATEVGRYEIVAGHRRFAACQLLAAEGVLTSVPAIVTAAVSRGDMLITMLIENLQRSDISVFDEARGFMALTTAHGFDVAALSKAVGKRPAYIFDRLALLTLPEVMHQCVDEGKVSLDMAGRVAKVTDSKVQENLADLASKGQLHEYSIDGALRRQETAINAKKFGAYVERVGLTVHPDLKEAGLSWNQVEHVGTYSLDKFKALTVEPNHVFVLRADLMTVYRLLTDAEIASADECNELGLDPGQEGTPYHDWRRQYNEWENERDRIEEARQNATLELIVSLPLGKLEQITCELVATAVLAEGVRYSRFPLREFADAAGITIDPVEQKLMQPMREWARDRRVNALSFYVARTYWDFPEGSLILTTMLDSMFQSRDLITPEMPDNLKIEPWQDENGEWVTDREIEPEPDNPSSVIESFDPDDDYSYETDEVSYDEVF